MLAARYKLGMSPEPTNADLLVPRDVPGIDLDLEAAHRLLGTWHHPKPERWLRHKLDEQAIVERGDPPRIRTADLWRELLQDECDKLYNQAWCALDQIREAEDEESVMFLAMDDLPSAVEQAYSLAPPLAREHLALLRDYKPERHQDVLRELGIGTGREDAERMECLAFWEENAEGISDLRRTLYRLVRGELDRRLIGR